MKNEFDLREAYAKLHVGWRGGQKCGLSRRRAGLAEGSAQEIVGGVEHRALRALPDVLPVELQVRKPEHVTGADGRGMSRRPESEPTTRRARLSAAWRPEPGHVALVSRIVGLSDQKRLLRIDSRRMVHHERRIHVDSPRRVHVALATRLGFAASTFAPDQTIHSTVYLLSLAKSL